MAHLKEIVSSQSSREGASPKLAVVHTTEGHDRPGIEDLKDLAALFNSEEASSHVANDAEGNDIRLVPDSRKAWTCCNFNAVSVNLEQVGFASFSKQEWLRHREAQLHNTAGWLLYWHKEYAIPLQRGRIVGTRIVRYGVVGHSQLGQYGCGHHDPGSSYPFNYVIGYAKLQTLKRGSTEYRRLRRKLNRIRKRAGLQPIGT